MESGYSWHMNSRAHFSDYKEYFIVPLLFPVLFFLYCYKILKNNSSTYPHTNCCNCHSVYSPEYPPYWDRDDATSVTARNCFTT